MDGTQPGPSQGIRSGRFQKVMKVFFLFFSVFCFGFIISSCFLFHSLILIDRLYIFL